MLNRCCDKKKSQTGLIPRCGLSRLLEELFRYLSKYRFFHTPLSPGPGERLPTTITSIHHGASLVPSSFRYHVLLRATGGHLAARMA